MESGHEVIGVDSFSNFLYAADIKRERIKNLNQWSNFRFIELDLIVVSLDFYLKNVDCVINFAALPGQAKSWESFKNYQDSNLLIVSNILNSLKNRPEVYFIQISSSSVFGNSRPGNREFNPLSPYGVTRLAAEHLVRVYQETSGNNSAILRLFPVFAPDQRSDMAYAKFCKALVENKEITIFGDGSQVRSNTFVDDAAQAIYLAAEARISNLIADVSSGENISLLSALSILEKEFDTRARILFVLTQVGDQDFSMGDVKFLESNLKFQVATTIPAGLKLQADYFKKVLNR